MARLAEKNTVLFAVFFRKAEWFQMMHFDPASILTTPLATATALAYQLPPQLCPCMAVAAETVHLAVVDTSLPIPGIRSRCLCPRALGTRHPDRDTVIPHSRGHHYARAPKKRGDLVQSLFHLPILLAEPGGICQ
jgi:hypothetical protein